MHRHTFYCNKRYPLQSVFLIGTIFTVLIAGRIQAQDADVVPADLSGVTVTARGENGTNEGKEKAFDNSTSTKWLDFSNTTWIQVQFTNGKKYVLSAYSITSANDAQGRDPEDWQLLGSNDGSTWTTLDSRTGQTFATRYLRQEYTTTTSGEFSYFRLDITLVATPSGNITQLSEIELIGHEASSNNPPTAVISANPTSGDPPLTVNFDATGSSDPDSDPLTYDWQFGDGGSSTSATTSHQYTSAGSYTVTLTVDDGNGGTDVATTNISVGITEIFSTDFNSDAQGFSYADDAFRGTSQPSYASGTYSSSGGYGGTGGLEVTLGATSGTINNMSGGWSYTFNLAQAGDVELSLRYNLIQSSEYESDEYSQSLVSVDGTLYGTSPNDYIAQIAGDGNGGSEVTTGWQQFTATIPSLSAGNHTIIVGGYNNKATYSNEITTIRLDDIVLTAVGGSGPTITTQPSNQTVTEGQSATFTVVASGNPPLSYQWRKNGTDISGATSASYTTPATTTADNGAQFDVVVSNTGGSVTSNAATLTVNALPPVIVAHPVSQTVDEGQTATFTVTATSSVPMTYQWRKNGSNISGATSAAYTTPAATMADNGALFSCVVSNSGGSVTSNTATLTVNALPPVITSHPVSQSVNEGQSATFTVTATSSLPMTYQWRKNGVNISGATSANYTTPPATIGDNGAQFDVVVSNTAGSVTSNAATLTVNVLPPVITTHPVSQTVDEGQTATFTVTATSSVPMTYQWRKNGVNISGATDSIYTTPPASTGDNGAQFDVIVSNTGGSVTSNAATLTVNALPPVITTHPVSQTVDEGQTATFTVTATSSVPMTYQWRKDGVNISGATSTTYTTPPATIGDNGAQFDVVVSNTGGSVTSNTAMLTVNGLPPVITTHPASQAVNEGQTATFTVTATSSLPMTYQWRKNGVNISGATDTIYTTPPATIGDNGAQFDVVVSNAEGSVTSNTATLTVNALPPVITTQPADQTVEEGQTATFTVVATSSIPMTYQWRLNGGNIVGATAASYTTPPVTMADDGNQYDVIVSNTSGSVTSSVAVLTVLEEVVPPSIVTQPVNQTVKEGHTATFTVVAAGTQPLTYQWRKNGADITGATNPDYVTPPATLADDGAQFDVVVSNSVGTVTSDIALLSVTQGTPVNKKLAISGELVDDNGDPVGYPDPVTVDATIRLMDASTGGSALYTETFLAADQEGVLVENGLFVARLGEGTTDDDLQQVITDNAQLWVEITIDDGSPDTLLPRTPLTAAAYSLGGVPTAASSPQVLHGKGEPEVLGVKAAIGSYYINSEDNSTWLKVSNGWKQMD